DRGMQRFDERELQGVGRRPVEDEAPYRVVALDAHAGHEAVYDPRVGRTPALDASVTRAARRATRRSAAVRAPWRNARARSSRPPRARPGRPIRTTPPRSGTSETTTRGNRRARARDRARSRVDRAPPCSGRSGSIRAARARRAPVN